MTRARLTLLLLVAVLALGAVVPAAAREPLAAVVHVHSDLSTGELSLEALATEAERQRLDAVLLADNYLLRIEYGLPPFRALTRIAHEERSVLGAGLDRYLAKIAAVRSQFPRLVIVPGVEVMPHYRWTGSLFAGDLQLHDTQKNLLVYGLDAAGLAGLPSIGNPHVQHFGGQSVLDALPVLLVIPGLLVLGRKRQQRVRIARAFVIVRRRRWAPGLALITIGLAALVRGWPFTVDAHPFWEDRRLEPHQALIEYVAQRGGTTVWSFPEARDAGERAYGPVRVTWRTDPYADDLLRTARYTAFGALYEDTTRFERPGGGWDRALGEYVRGERSTPAWGLGESGYHGSAAGKRLGPVQTIFFARERSEAAILEAMRQGRMYALHRGGAAGLTVAEFAVTDGQASAAIGETLTTAAATPVQVRIAVDATGGPDYAVRVALVRNGSVVAGFTGPTPVRHVHREVYDGAPAFYRLEVSGPGQGTRLLTNPIFIKP
ncbi:MAG: hypothetical protein HYU41_12395 [Candidatus Rokubacteria bacterium]|nr:hypothetical protein [Candidatus Rokubacteria bacterium]